MDREITQVEALSSGKKERSSFRRVQKKEVKMSIDNDYQDNYLIFFLPLEFENKPSLDGYDEPMI